MNLNNNWVGYLDRSYQQIKDSVLSLLPTYTPEITDHTDSNPLVRMLDVWAGISEMLGYYIDNGAREAHLSSFRLYKSGVKIAKSYDYRVKSFVSSGGVVEFYLDASELTNTIIPSNTRVETEEGIPFYTQQSTTILAGQLKETVSVIQYDNRAQYIVGTSIGSVHQVFILDDNVVDNSVTVLIDGINWSIKETLGRSIYDDKHFVHTVNEDRDIIIYFGDDVNGAIPPVGKDISVSYKVCDGSTGNTGSETITKIIPPMSSPTVNVTNPGPTTGGIGIEPINLIKRRVPKSIRTLYRAVTRQDFIDVTELHPGVARAGIDFECSSAIQDYIIPVNGGGIASPSLIAAVQDWIDARKIFTLDVKVQSAGEVRIILVIDVYERSGYDPATVKSDVKDNLVEFLSYENQSIMGNVYLSDLYEVIELTRGVSHSDIKEMRPIPHAFRLGSTNVSLDWNVAILPSSTSTSKWKITMTDATNFDLYINSSFMGNYSVGNSITLSGLQFTVLSGSYSVGMAWEFYSYPYFGNLNVQGPSLPIAESSDITIN